ncbi:iron-sulfur cluster assembly scaffold protein [Falsigemmobacter intermedius]|uniref:Iron-sulfur cluster assembly scaffold protein n=1 Tax=Falsigemmobacter intermedius TaxID=1553448 RepID=A0A444MG81_9RHOB|nr:iron-sulfur cluster assembly scaffold protein [Falsigemmobacter intermedius]RWY44712.1 iron-sulfur cluster assembly scaffold protein [Falsigemmobacter intermedius]
MSDQDLMKLYSGKILDLTTRIPHLGTLSDPQAEARRRSPLCGSSVKAGVVLRDGRVAEFAQEVRACALGQAAAAITGGAVIGRSPAELRAAAEALAAMLEGGPVPPAPFDGFEVLTPAREFKNRHTSIRLALEAAAEAAEAAAAQV